MAPRSREELLSYGIPDPTSVAELEAHPPRAPQPTDAYYNRDVFEAAREHRATLLREKFHLRYLPGAIPEHVREEDRMIPVSDGAEIRVRIYTPTKAAQGPRPLIVMFHEGGWMTGDLTDEEVNCRLFARDLDAICVNVEYRLAPEHKFPTGHNDGWDALKWAAKHASSLGADPSAGFVIGGGSAGAGITAALAHVARDEKLSPPLTGQYLCVPPIFCLMGPDMVPEPYKAEYLSHPAVTPCKDPVLAGHRGRKEDDYHGFDLAIIGTYLQPDVKDPRFVPWLYGSREGGHKNLPPCYLQVCGIDPLRDEGLIYERVLREECGIKTKLDIYPGQSHYFWTNLPRLAESKKFVEDARAGMKWLLEQK